MVFLLIDWTIFDVNFGCFIMNYALCNQAVLSCNQGQAIKFNRVVSVFIPGRLSNSGSCLCISHCVGLPDA